MLSTIDQISEGAAQSATLDLIDQAREKLRLARFSTARTCDFVQLDRKDLNIIDHLLIEFRATIEPKGDDMAAIERRIKTGDLDPNGNEWEVE